ncbi:MAG: hypothetical protein ACK5MT_11590 [Actinomycetales bacterium]
MTRGLVLILGESLNDSRSILHLLIHANPALEGRVKPVPKPISLTRSASQSKVRDWVKEIDDVVRGYRAAGRLVTAVLVHRDADRHDPQGTEENRLNDQLRTIQARAVVPVRMIESWWFLFPDAVEAVRPKAWRSVMPRSARDVEAIPDPKRELIRITRKRGRHSYSEADSTAIAESIRRNNTAMLGNSMSYNRFRELARSIK